MRLAPEDLLPEEADCGQPSLYAPYRWLALDGYGLDEALVDRPFPPGGELDVFGWVQRVGQIWHERLVRLSDGAALDPERADAGGTAASCGNTGGEGRGPPLVLVVPPLHLFTSVDGIYAPRDLVEPLLARAADADRPVCVVALHFATAEDGEESLHVAHLARLAAPALAARLVRRSLVSAPADDDTCIPRHHCAGVGHAWTLGSRRALRKHATAKTQWVFLPAPPAAGAKRRRGGAPEGGCAAGEPRRKRTFRAGQWKKPPRELHLYYGRVPAAPSGAAVATSGRRPFNAMRDDVPAMFTIHGTEAVEYAMAFGLMVFAYDYDEKYWKKYVVCSYPAAFRLIFLRHEPTHMLPRAPRELTAARYQNMYEGMFGAYPQKLILDLEYMKADNPQWTDYPADADRITLAAIDFTAQVLAAVDPAGWAPARDEWLILEADSDAKMSRHAILNARVPGKYFRSMVDAAKFRDVLETAVQAGIVMRAPATLAILATKRVEVAADTGRLATRPKSIAHQCYLPDASGGSDGLWKTCVIDWSIVNDRFRLMRPYGCTKIGQNRFLRVCKTINRHRPPWCAAGYLGHSRDFRTFMSSMVHAVRRTCDDGGGWALTLDQARALVAPFGTMVNGYLAAELELPPTALPRLLQELKFGPTLDAERRRGAQRGGTLRRLRPALGLETLAAGGSARPKVAGDPRGGPMTKEPLGESDPRFEAILSVLAQVEGLKAVVENTHAWRITACTATDDESAVPPTMFWATPQSTLCPIGGVHRDRGKTCITITRRGKISAMCFKARCCDTVWRASERVGAPGLELLWPARR